MDDTAGNYNPAATDDDGSCGDLVVLTMVDSWGDGWNGGCITVNGGDTCYQSEAAGGVEVEVEIVVPTGSCFTWEYTPGSYSNENGYTVSHNGVVIGEWEQSDWSYPAVDSGTAGTCVSGCSDPLADNYNPDADLADDSLCEYSDVYGCMDDTAGNYNPDATADDGACGDLVVLQMVDSYGDTWNGGCITVNGGDTCYQSEAAADVVVEVEIIVPTGSCFTWEYNPGSWAGENTYAVWHNGVVLASWSGSDGSKSGNAGGCVSGCSDSAATNYNPDADIADDASCEYAGIPGCTNESAWNYSVDATLDDGSCVDRVYIEMDDSWGDGWNGACLSFDEFVSCVNPEGSFGGDGPIATAEVFVPVGSCAIANFLGGSYDYEISFEMSVNDSPWITVASVSDGNRFSSCAGGTCGEEGTGAVLDCVGTCVSESVATTWPGDGYCDAGEYGFDAMCESYFYDYGDCG
jgi:hypothetical protein